MRPSRLFVVVASVLVMTSVLSAQITLTPTISNNVLTAGIQLPGGVGADLSITFEQVIGLNANALSLTAALVDVTDTSILTRLPDPSLISLPASFPVIVHIEPTPTSPLSFSGIYNLSLYTHNLTLTTNSPLRLFRSPSGGVFQDMTGYLGTGSVRAGGSSPGFSDFLIVVDTRSVDSVINAKFDALQALLSTNSATMPSSVAGDLQQRLNQARSLYKSGSLAAAIDAITDFSSQVKMQSGTNIPDVWRANSSLVNVAGLLRSAADTLKFSLNLKANGAS